MATLTDQELDNTFRALADPTRRAILARLAHGEASVNELAEPFDLTLQAVSKHIKVLEHSGLVSRRREAQSRPCRLETQSLESAIEWIDRRRQEWDDRFDALDRHLKIARTSSAEEATTGRTS